MNKKTLLWVAILGGAGYGIWWMVKNMHVTPRQKSILDIEEKSYSGLEDAYLKAWGDAVKAGKPDFTYNGKVYNSVGGSVKR
jgi:hypothetical protein